MYGDVCKLEEYIHEKEHAELIQSLGTYQDKLCDDEEITEENLYAGRNNPFVKGREKKEDEEVEINFESTL